MELEQRNFRADPLKLKRLRIAASMSAQEFQKASGLNKDTTRKLLRGEPVFLSTLSQAVRKAFNIDNPLEVLHPDELAALGAETKVPSPEHVLEWEIEEYHTERVLRMYFGAAPKTRGLGGPRSVLRSAQRLVFQLQGRGRFGS